MRQVLASQRFHLIELFLVIMGGVIWMLKPEMGLWSILIALLPWMLRILSGNFPFRRTSFDWLVAIFLTTALVGYWVSYDRTAAWNKFWLIVAAVLLYYSLANQPGENLIWVYGLFFCLGFGIAIYFFLTHDFIGAPRKVVFVNLIGRWIMENRPQFGWMPIHPNYVAGLMATTVPFVVYPVWKLSKNIKAAVILFYGFVVIGLGVSLLAFGMATSRGAVMAVAGGAGVWLLWMIISSGRINLRLRGEAAFPFILLLYLTVVIAVLYMGPARSGSGISGQDSFGTGSRAELFSRSVYFLADFPFTGGGLGSFPGLFSQYVLNIPFYSLPNAHNVFLDVFIEQGLFGGSAYLLMYVTGIWMTARMLGKTQSFETKIVVWIGLFALVVSFIHGMVDDYLYYEDGAILSLVFVGVTSNISAGQLLVDKKQVELVSRYAIPLASTTFFLVIGLLIFNVDRIRSSWHANLGAVEMAKVELMDFPANEWAGTKYISNLTTAEESLLSSLQFDSHNQTANHRLGLIALSQKDFSAALDYLLEAHHQSPRHRGIIKSLGYCYVWLGDMDRAGLLLKDIPESKNELDVYIWWWGGQGRHDLSEKAAVMSSALAALAGQP